MLVSLAMTGLLLVVMPCLLFLTGYLVKRYTVDRPIRSKTATGKATQTRAKPLYGQYVRKRAKPLYVERT